MYTISLHPIWKMNIKAVMLVPLLLLSMFAIVPIMTSQIAPSLAKISPTLWNEMANADETINVLIKTFTNDYSSVVKQINDLGGNVGFLFKYVNGLSASLPANKIVELSKNSMIERMYYDVKRQLTSGPGESLMMPRGDDLDALLAVPTIAEASEYATVSTAPAELAGLKPVNYWNTKAMGAEDIWGETNYGEDSLVVIIDTGMWEDHFMFAGTDILGGVDMSYDVGKPTYEGWSNINNHYHGGHVAGTVASTGGIIVSPGTSLYIYAEALEMYSGVPLPTDPITLDKTIWLLGMAPAATLYMVKVFDHTGGSIPESMVIAGMEHALNLKIIDGYDVDVVSMSIGGGSVYDGRDMEDTLVDIITANDITLVAAAGNEGPASMTVGSPGSANTAITAGAAANPVNTKAFWDYNYNWPGIGDILFTSSTPQIYAFSSRGPTSDGRSKPTLSATGIYVLSAYCTGGNFIAWASGTSMATPAISGATALINAYAEANTLGASPEDYKQALTGGAVWLPGYNQYDQGAGYLNAANALMDLKADTSLGDVAPPLPDEAELMDIQNIPIVTQGVYTTSITDLPPGHKMEYIFQVTESTDSIRLDVTNVELGTDPVGMNSFEVYIQSAKRTTYDYYVDSANVYGDSTFYITEDARVIEPGYVRVVIENDWTSYDSASADITIEVTKAKKTKADITLKGRIWPYQGIGWIEVPVPPGTTEAIIELWWTHDWRTYPTADLDLILIWNGAFDFRGATFNSPERVVLTGPTGSIYLLIDGYAIYTGREPFEVRITFV